MRKSSTGNCSELDQTEWRTIAPFFTLPPSLHLRRHQLDRVFLHVHHGKQHHHFLPLIDDLADARLQNLFA